MQLHHIRNGGVHKKAITHEQFPFVARYLYRSLCHDFGQGWLAKFDGVGLQVLFVLTPGATR